MYVPTNRTLEMSLGSEFNVHPILQLVPHDTENTAHHVMIRYGYCIRQEEKKYD